MGRKERGLVESLFVPKEVRSLVADLIARRKIREDALLHYKDAVFWAVVALVLFTILLGGPLIYLIDLFLEAQKGYFVSGMLSALVITSLVYWFFFSRNLFSRRFYVCTVGTPTRAYLGKVPFRKRFGLPYKYQVDGKYYAGASDPFYGPPRKHYENHKPFRVYYLKGREKISCLVEDYWMSRYCLDVDQYKKWQKEAFG